MDIKDLNYSSNTVKTYLYYIKENYERFETFY